jgi:flagellar motor switch protein FliG
METPATTEAAPPMTRTRKLAALLIILGPDSAAQMLKSLNERELEAVSLEMSRLPVISRELQEEILGEFAEVAVEASTTLLGGANYTRVALEKSVGQFRAADILSRTSPSPVPLAAMQQITDMDARQLFNLIRNEQPQTIALVASYLPPEKASQIIELLHTDLREEVVERLATLAPTPVEVVERIAEVIRQKSGGKTTGALSQTGGVKGAADVLNSLDKKLSQSVLQELEKRNPELVTSIRQKMFTFEDLARLDTSALQKIMREVDMRDLAVSLKTASDKLKKTLFSAISKRAAETVNEEISFLGPLKKKDIEAAQLRIIDSVRQLEAEGEVDLSNATSPSRDEVLV